MENQSKWEPIAKLKKLSVPDMEETEVLFDNGETCKFMDEDWPIAIATHYRLLND